MTLRSWEDRKLRSWEAGKLRKRKKEKRRRREMIGKEGKPEMHLSLRDFVT